MTLDYSETKILIDLVLQAEKDQAITVLRTGLSGINRKEQEFYEGVIKHGPDMTSYTSDQWLDFHQKIDHWRLRDEKALMNKLSKKQRETLGILY